jgi:hypothetical protein
LSVSSAVGGDGTGATPIAAVGTVTGNLTTRATMSVADRRGRSTATAWRRIVLSERRLRCEA